MQASDNSTLSSGEGSGPSGSVRVFSRFNPLLLPLRCQELQLRFHGFRRLSFPSPEGSFYVYLKTTGKGTTPIIFLHGLGMSAEQWRPQMIDLAGSRSSCAIEFLGFGRSMAPGLSRHVYGIELYVRQVEYLRRILGWRRPILAGVSMGGWVATAYALAHPHNVAGLVLVAPAGVSPGASGDRWERLVDGFNCRTPKELRRFITTYLLSRRIPIPLWACRAGLAWIDRGGYRPFMENIRDQPWVADRLGEIAIPVGVVWGTRDRVFPFDGAEHLRANIKISRIFPAHGAGHAFMYEHPRRAVAAFRRTLNFTDAHLKDG